MRASWEALLDLGAELRRKTMACEVCPHNSFLCFLGAYHSATDLSTYAIGYSATGRNSSNIFWHVGARRVGVPHACSIEEFLIYKARAVGAGSSLERALRRGDNQKLCSRLGNSFFLSGDVKGLKQFSVSRKRNSAAEFFAGLASACAAFSSRHRMSVALAGSQGPL